MKRIMQFRYKGTKSTVDNGTYTEAAENYPHFANYRDKLIKGNIFQEYGRVSQLGIQGPIGLCFYLNNSNHPIMIGETGIYELDLEGIGYITSIRFENFSEVDEHNLDHHFLREREEDDKADRLLIDIIYEGA